VLTTKSCHHSEKISCVCEIGRWGGGKEAKGEGVLRDRKKVQRKKMVSK